MALTKQKIKDIVEGKTNKDFEQWKADALQEHMLMLMQKGKDYKQWEDQFVEEKVIELLIEDAKKSAKKSNDQSSIGGN